MAMFALHVLEWPYVALYSLVAFHDHGYVRPTLTKQCFMWPIVVAFLWPYLHFMVFHGRVSFLAVIDPNSFGLVRYQFVCFTYMYGQSKKVVGRKCLLLVNFLRDTVSQSTHESCFIFLLNAFSSSLFMTLTEHSCLIFSKILVWITICRGFCFVFTSMANGLQIPNLAFI